MPLGVSVYTHQDSQQIEIKSSVVVFALLPTLPTVKLKQHQLGVVLTAANVAPSDQPRAETRIREKKIIIPTSSYGLTYKLTNTGVLITPKV